MVENMVENKEQKMHNAGWSDCHSFISYPYGRSRKASIGITVEKYPKMGSGVRKEDGAVLPNNEKTFSFKGKIVEENRGDIIEEHREPEIVETFDIRQAEGKHQKAAAWFSSRSVRLETPNAETVQIYTNEASIVQAKDGLHKKLDTVAYGKREEKCGNIERVEEVSFAVMQEVHLPNKGIGSTEPEGVVKCNNEVLRTKIWEILGTAPSQRKHIMDTPNIEDEKENVNINQTEHARGKVPQPKHNSDTIETDSESPNLTTRRPITRSLTKKRSPSKTLAKLKGGIKCGKKPLSSSGSDSKLKLQETNIFAFDAEEREYGSIERTASGHSNRIIMKGNAQKDIIPPKRIYSRRLLILQNGLQTNNREQTMSSPSNSSLQSKETEGSPNLPCLDKEYLLQTPSRKKKSRLEPHKVYCPRRLVPEKNLQPSEKDRTLPTPDKASIQSKETTDSPGPFSQGKKSFMEKSGMQEKAKVESLRIHSPKESVSKKNLQPNEMEQSLTSLDGTSVQTKKTHNDSHHSQADAHREIGNLPFAYNAESRDLLMRMKEYPWEHEMSTPMQKGSDLHKKFASPPLEMKTDLLDDFPSPTLAMNATPSSPSSSKILGQVFSVPILAQPNMLTRNIYSSKILDDFRPGSCGSDANTETADDSGKTYESQDTPSQHAKEKETGNKLSVSPMEDQELESNGAEDVMDKGFRQSDKQFPDARSLKEFPSILCHNKQNKSVCYSKTAMAHSIFKDDANWFLGDGNPKKPRHSKGVNSLIHTELRTEEMSVLHNASEQHPKTTLESDIAELALVLERFKGKLKSQTSEKCSEILSAAAEKIHLQLQDVESLILVDVGKFNNTGKSKRKRFESILQGQQEKMKLVHDKFKEEVTQQLHCCRNSLEELEAHQMELKGSTDRQKASHRKLLQQVEEIMKAELRDAETRITAIDKEARKKMYGLKHVLKEWMEDGVIR